MTFQKMYSDLLTKNIKLEKVKEELMKKDKMKSINYYAHIYDINNEPLTDSQLSELNAIVRILQIMYNSSIESPVSDTVYDNLQELLVNMGIPRLTGSIEINDNKKVSGKFTKLRGTLDKIYYLTLGEKRINKSRKYLDEWIKSTEELYFKKTGKHIDLNNEYITCQAKYDGVSAILEWDGKNAIWISRGDTSRNKASDITHIMKIFNDIFAGGRPVGIKFEVMVSEENKNHINELNDIKYKHSRQAAIAITNSNEADFKCEYLYPVPLRIQYEGDEIEELHPDQGRKFPTITCKLSEREKIREFALHHRYVEINGHHLRTDGVVLTFVDPELRKILGRDNNINNFEVAYKFTEESAHSKVKDVLFYVSNFGYIVPVLHVNDVIMKGSNINHISLSNKERFDELDLHYGDEVKVLYDIIPYAIIDETCCRVPNGRKIEFTKECPECGEPLDLNQVQVQCKNPECPSRIVGNILNYCTNVKIQNIGYNTLDTLYTLGFLNHGIRSLYKLKKKKEDIENLPGFGKIKTKKIVSEIEAKRKLRDYDFFGAIGIEGLSRKSFQLIFNEIPLTDFLNLIKLKNWNLLSSKLVSIKGMGDKTSQIIIDYFSDLKRKIEVDKILKEVSLIETYNTKQSKGRIVFTGCRANDDLTNFIENKGYEVSDSWSNSAKYLVVPNKEFTSSKVGKAESLNIPIITINEIKEKLKG